MKKCDLKRRFFCLLFLGMGALALAADFGIVLSPEGEYGSNPGGRGFGFTGTVVPWFSASPSENINLYLSAKLTFERSYDGGGLWWPPLIELDRTEVNLHPARSVYLTLGRQRFGHGGGMIAQGLFDGLYGSFGLGRLRLAGGAFYTGFLYKESAEILMTQTDRDRYAPSLDYGDLDSYFASRRVLVPLSLEFPDLSSRLSLFLGALAQFDLNPGAGLYTQYLEARFGVEAADTLNLAFTGIGALGEREGGDPQAHFAGALALDWEFPGTLTDMLRGELQWGSGAVNRRIGPFTPVNGKARGIVFTPALGGIMNARLSYTARPHRIFSFTAESIAFWRTDLETFRETELDGASKKRFLGTEADVRLILALQSALRLTAGGGVFFPGGAFAGSAGIRWKINAGINFSL